MRLTVNGRSGDYQSRLSLEELVAAIVTSGRGTAVAVDGTVVPRSRWGETMLAEGQTVEVVTAVGGG